MKATKFDEIVKNRANERVQAKIKRLRKTILQAIAEASGSQASHYILENPKAKLPETWLKVLGVLGSEDRSKKWPLEWWAKEEERVSKELLATMDEMQKALLAPKPSDDDCTPEADAEAEGL